MFENDQKMDSFHHFSLVAEEHLELFCSPHLLFSHFLIFDVKVRSAVSVTVLWIGIADAVLITDTDVRGRMCPSLFLCL